MINTKIGLELTLLPNKPGKYKEFLKKSEAINVVAKLNREFKYNLRLRNFRAKADSFRAEWRPSGERLHRSWCVEVNVKESIDTFEFLHLQNKQEFETFFAVAKSLNLYPRFERKQRDGTIIHFPTGAGHIHLGIDLWQQSNDYLAKLHFLQRLLTLDFANHPYIRWFFCQWFDDRNTDHLITWRKINETTKQFIDNPEKGCDAITADVLNSLNVQQRFAGYGKAVYATWENRYFDMPANYEELTFQVLFLHHWVRYHDLVFSSVDFPDSLKQCCKFTLTQKRFNRLATDPEYTKSQLIVFFKRIGLDIPPQFNTMFNRNCRNRILHGNTIHETS